MVHNIIIHGGPEVTQLADVWHLTRVMVLSHVLGQVAGGGGVLLTDTTHQDLVAQMNLKINIIFLKIYCYSGSFHDFYFVNFLFLNCEFLNWQAHTHAVY